MSASTNTISVGGRRLPYPAPTSAAVSKQMRGNRRVGTRPEQEVRSALQKLGLRFRKDYSIAAGGVRVRPDIVFTKRRLAIFIDGCFWHSCPVHGRTPSTNSPYWQAKLARNVERDDRNDRALETAGWKVARYWEHEPPASVANAVLALLGQRGVDTS